MVTFSGAIFDLPFIAKKLLNWLSLYAILICGFLSEILVFGWAKEYRERSVFRGQQ